SPSRSWSRRHLVRTPRRAPERKENQPMSAEPYSNVASLDQAPGAASLSSRRGIAILLLLSLVQFMDILDASILNIALPSIKNDLGFSQQGLQWVVNGYILSYGGFLLLGGRMADLLGRRFVLVTGLVVFAGSSLAGVASFDALGVRLVAGGMLLLVYARVRAPDVGWGATRTIAELAVAALTLVAFVANELRVASPLVPMSILRVRGIAVADATQ